MCKCSQFRERLCLFVCKRTDKVYAFEIGRYEEDDTDSKEFLYSCMNRSLSMLDIY